MLYEEWAVKVFALLQGKGHEKMFRPPRGPKTAA